MTSQTALRQHRRAAVRGSVGRAGFGQLLRSEWVKFVSVRGWVIGMIVAGLLTLLVGVFLAGNGSIGCQNGPNSPR